MSCHTQLVRAPVPDDRFDSYRSPGTLDICRGITLVSSCGEVKLCLKNILESVRCLTLPASGWWGLLDLVDVLTIAIDQA